MCLFERQNEREGERVSRREERERDSSYEVPNDHNDHVGARPKARARSLILVPCRDGRHPELEIFFCIPRCISNELDPKHSF